MQNKTVHPSLTKVEKALLENYFYLPGWQFDEVMKRNCTQMDSHHIARDEGGWEYAIVYGLKGMKADTKESCIANYFVRYRSRLYQANHLEKILSIIRVLKKEEEVDEYWTKFYKKRSEERERMKIEKQELKVKKLKSPVKKVA